MDHLRDGADVDACPCCGLWTHAEASEVVVDGGADTPPEHDVVVARRAVGETSLPVLPQRSGILRGAKNDNVNLK